MSTPYSQKSTGQKIGSKVKLRCVPLFLMIAAAFLGCKKLKEGGAWPSPSYDYGSGYDSTAYINSTGQYNLHKIGDYPDSSTIDLYRDYYDAKDTINPSEASIMIYTGPISSIDTTIKDKLQRYKSESQRTYCRWRVQGPNSDVLSNGKTPEIYISKDDPADTNYTFEINY